MSRLDRSRRVAERPGAGPYDMFSYWLMPHGLRGLLTTVLRPAASGVARPRRQPGRSPWPGPRLPFPVLAPGKIERAVGEHTFWRGPLWDRSVALQGDSTFTKFDLFELTEDAILYWGTFRGNGFYGSEESHSFSSPYKWMDRWMSVGDFTEQRVVDSLLDPRRRRVANIGELTLRVEVVAHHGGWTDPDSGIGYSDVLEVHYWGRYPEETSKEIYFLAPWLGTIRFISLNEQEPSGVHYQYAEYFERYSPPDTPTVPWFDPFENRTHVPNGFFEDFLVSPSNGAPIAGGVRGWSGSSDAVVSNDAPDEGTGPWQIAHKGSTGGGDTAPDLATPSGWIPVTPGRRYRLSGRIWRVSEKDNVYLDFDDGRGLGQDFEDAQAMASRVHRWEPVAAETTVGPGTRAIKVRCVRDGANAGNAYFDGITLQRLD